MPRVFARVVLVWGLCLGSAVRRLCADRSINAFMRPCASSMTRFLLPRQGARDHTWTWSVKPHGPIGVKYVHNSQQSGLAARRRRSDFRRYYRLGPQYVVAAGTSKGTDPKTYNLIRIPKGVTQ
eukprot:scaffold10021_cov147-Isochrysis_galbana.AAC.3